MRVYQLPVGVDGLASQPRMMFTLKSSGWLDELDGAAKARRPQLSPLLPRAFPCALLYPPLSLDPQCTAEYNPALHISAHPKTLMSCFFLSYAEGLKSSLMPRRPDVLNCPHFSSPEPFPAHRSSLTTHSARCTHCRVKPPALHMSAHPKIQNIKLMCCFIFTF